MTNSCGIGNPTLTIVSEVHKSKSALYFVIELAISCGLSPIHIHGLQLKLHKSKRHPNDTRFTNKSRSLASYRYQTTTQIHHPLLILFGSTNKHEGYVVILYPGKALGITSHNHHPEEHHPVLRMTYYVSYPRLHGIPYIFVVGGRGFASTLAVVECTLKN